MRMALYCRAIALGLSVVWLAATPAAADSLVVEPTAATPAVEAAPIPAAVDLEYDPLFEDFLEEASPTNDPFEGTNRAFLKTGDGPVVFFNGL